MNNDNQATETLTIKTSLTLDDLTQFSVDHDRFAKTTYRRKGPKRFLKAMGFGMLGGVIVGVSTAFLHIDLTQLPVISDKPFWIGALGTASALGILVLFFRTWLIKGQTKDMYDAGKNRSLFSPTNYDFAKDGITVTNEFSRNETKWGGIEAIRKSDHAIYIYLSALASWILPRRAFESDDDFGNAHKKLLDWYEQSPEHTEQDFQQENDA